jgi:hypothetical protein
MKRIMHTFAPFARKLGNIPEEGEDLAQQAIEEMQRPDFVAIWRMETVWGIRS